MTQPLMIQVNNLSQRVSVGKEQLTILDQIQLQVKSGESLAIVGASGSGKSTLLGMLAGLDLPSEGEIFIAGQALHLMDEEQRAKLRSEKIGFVFQSFLLIPELTALENVMLPAELRGIKQARELATTLLKEVGLGERLQHKPAKLSGGEQQRVALARAFICQPALLLADEPTGNLDQHTGQKIADLLFRMNQESGSSLVIVTHDVALATRCQRQVHMQAGQLEESR
jgi:putative ABC transport system ATP-binding protein